MRTAELDFELPEALIAQTPIEPRDASRLMVLDRGEGGLRHQSMRDLPELLRSGDLLVVNDSRVLPARLHGRKISGGGAVEVLLLREREPGVWEALMRPSRRLRPGTAVAFGELTAVCAELLGDGLWALAFAPSPDLMAEFERLGEAPLPPYIHRRLDDPERYQTIYARHRGSAAAPTAGLHFTPALLDRLEARGVRRAGVTLHVGLDTFRPVGGEVVEDHPMHSEAWSVSPETAALVCATKAAGGRVVAIGTTSVRALETAAAGGTIAPGGGWTRLFITPGYRFRVVDALLTNFHLPRTTLLALVAAFAGLEPLRAAYQEAFREQYRLLSFGDAMLIMGSGQ